MGSSTRGRCDIFNNLENMAMAEWDVNNIVTLNKELGNTSEIRFVRERAKRVFRRALLVINNNIEIDKLALSTY